MRRGQLTSEPNLNRLRTTYESKANQFNCNSKGKFMAESHQTLRYMFRLVE